MNANDYAADIFAQTADLTGWDANHVGNYLAGSDLDDDTITDLEDDVLDELRTLIGSAIAGATYTAVITGRGADSSYPNNDGAVDADITITVAGKATITGEVTLAPDHTGELVASGDGWASDDLRKLVDSLDNTREVVSEIEGVVNQAAK